MFSRSGATRWLRVGAWLCAVACARSGGENSGVVVRQVLRGSEAKSADVAPTADAAAAGASLVQAVAPSGATLVADSPQAIYRHALELARKNADQSSAHARLSAIEAQMDQQLEEDE